MFKLAMEVCFENHFGSIQAIILSLGSTKSAYFFWDNWYTLCPFNHRHKSAIFRLSTDVQTEYNALITYHVTDVSVWPILDAVRKQEDICRSKKVTS